jgi:hypothetical protein
VVCPALGIGGVVLTLAAAICAIMTGAPSAQRWPVLLAGCRAVAHSFTTARAAPINFSQRNVSNDEAALRGIFDRLERWQTVRAALQLATFLAIVRALAATARTSSSASVR